MNWHILTYFWLITIEWSQSILYHTGWCLYFNFSNNTNRWAQTQYHSLRASSIKTAMVYCRMCWWRARSHALQTPPHTLCQLQVICLAGCSNTWDIRRRSANPAATAHRRPICDVHTHTHGGWRTLVCVNEKREKIKRQNTNLIVKKTNHRQWKINYDWASANSEQ